MSDIQVCEGVWRNRLGQRLVITQCEPVDGQHWTDGEQRYSDDGSFYGRYAAAGELCKQDLVEYLGPLPPTDQSAEIERLKADNEQLRSANEYVASLEQQLDEARNTISELRVSHVALEHHTDGMQSAFLAVIKALAGGRR